MTRKVPLSLTDLALMFTQQLVADAEKSRSIQMDMELLRQRVSQLEKYKQESLNSHITIARLQEQLMVLKQIQADLVTYHNQNVKIRNLEQEALLLRCRIAEARLANQSKIVLQPGGVDDIFDEDNECMLQLLFPNSE